MEEDFDLGSLAKYLHLTPSQVEKMANRGQLPARRVGGQWRFSASEIHHWFEQRIGLSDQSELVEVEQVLDRHADSSLDAPPIVELMQPDAIWIPLNARTKNSVIDTICQLSAQAGLLWDPNKMAEAIRNRESMHSTALENGAALLHPRRPISNIISQPFLALGITASGIPFGGPRGCLTDVFFLVASSDDQGHLRTLARLSRIIGEPFFLEQLRQLPTPSEVISFVDETVKKLESK